MVCNKPQNGQLPLKSQMDKLWYTHGAVMNIDKLQL